MVGTDRKASFLARALSAKASVSPSASSAMPATANSRSKPARPAKPAPAVTPTAWPSHMLAANNANVVPVEDRLSWLAWC